MENTFMKKKIIGLLAGFLFAFLLYAPVSFAAGGTIYVSLERFTLGQGYLVEPETMTFKDGETYEDIIKRLAKKHGLVLKDKYTEHGYYLVGIKNADTGKLNIPKAVTEMAPSGEGASAVYPPTNDQNDGNDNLPDLEEFDYSSLSGWYYLVNGNNLGISMSGLKPHNGDVCRFMFTLFGLGQDVENPSLPNRDKATRIMALMNSNRKVTKAKGWESAYSNAVKVVSNLDSDQAAFNKALSSLPSETVTKNAIQDEQNRSKYTPKKAVIKKVKAGKKKAKIVWKKQSGVTGYVLYMSKKPSKGYKKIKKISAKKKPAFVKTSLKSKKKYYFKIRAYRKVGTKVDYGSYSSVKKVKIK